MEVLPIAAQRLYVLLKLGKVGEAEILCKDLTIEEFVNPSQAPIADLSNSI